MLQLAKNLRQRMTDAEQRLWYHLRAKRFSQWKFKRQHVLGAYIVDFVCLEARVIIEADGGQHLENPKDAKRDACLRSQGFRVLRFWNDEVLQNTEGVLQVVHAELSAPSPLPLPREGGEKRKNSL